LRQYFIYLFLVQVRDRDTNTGKGIGFVLFKTKEAARAALNMNGSELNGRQIRVTR
jgi:nucleolar protein 12